MTTVHKGGPDTMTSVSPNDGGGGGGGGGGGRIRRVAPSSCSSCHDTGAAGVSTSS